MTVNKLWLTPKELKEEFGFSESTQAKYRMHRKIPYSKIGRYVRYNRDEIHQWLENNKIEMVA